MLLLFRRVVTTVDCVAPDEYRIRYFSVNLRLRFVKPHKFRFLNFRVFITVRLGNGQEETAHCVYVQKVMTLHGPRGS